MHFISSQRNIVLLASVLNSCIALHGHTSRHTTQTMSLNSILANVGLSLSHRSPSPSTSSSKSSLSSSSSSSSSSGSSTPSRDVSPVRLLGVVGDKGKTNDVVYCKASTEFSDTIVFFPGDVQDYPEEMSPEYSEYNLEKTAVLLSTSFPDRHILVIKPNRMELKTYACYDNFVPCDQLGIPTLTSSPDALNHMERLLQGVAHRIAVPSLAQSKLTLVGFSKGCVPLNSLLYSASSRPAHPLLSLVSQGVWLDGGHGGKENTWVTDRHVLEAFAKLGVGVSIFVSPYQVSDPRRPCIQREENTFHETLKELGVPVSRHLLCQHLPASLKSHFMLFKQAVQTRFT